MPALLADLILVAHFAFIVFVVAGGALVWRWPQLSWVHLPAVVWGAAVEFFGWICPLTPLEDHLRRLAGDRPEHGDFIARHLLPLIYPEGLTRDVEILLGTGALAINIVVYALLMRRRR